MKYRTRRQRHQQLMHQYVLSRRTMLALMGFACAPGLEALLDHSNETSRPTVPRNPQIPSLPQDDRPRVRLRRQQQLQQAREEYQLATRLPNVVRVANLPPQEDFSEQYQANRESLRSQLAANQEAFLANPVPFLSLEDYAAVFPVLPLPDVATSFRQDATFAQQRLSGTDPMELTNVLALNYRLRDKMAITNEIFRAVVGDVGETLNSAMRSGSLFVTDYGVLDNVTPQAGRFITSPICLYFADRRNPRSPLIPIAIQLGQVRGESLLCTPLDGVDWTLAKMVAQMAEFTVFQLIRHLGQTHLALEPIALATARELAQNHPLYVLLQPHFDFTMAINAFADQVLINPGGFVNLVFPGILESSLSLTNQAVSEQFSNFSDFAFPNNLRLRGVTDREQLPNFPYRDDGLPIWEALRDYVTQYVRIYYQTRRDVRQDVELQNWLQALRTPVSDGGLGVVSLPERLTNRNQLVDLLTQIIFTAGPQHSAIAWLQYDYAAFMPNMPGSIYQPSPNVKGTVSEADLSGFLPDTELTFAQLTLMTQVGTKLDPKAFTNFGSRSFQDPRAIRVLRMLQHRLDKIEEVIGRRNQRRGECYIGFLPSRMANSTSA